MPKKDCDVVYVTHTCKNKACGAGFVDVDDNNATFLPPTTKYCPECKAKGFAETMDIRGANGRKNLLRLIENKKNSAS